MNMRRFEIFFKLGFYVLITAMLHGCVSGNILPILPKTSVQNDEVGLFIATTRLETTEPDKHFSGERTAKISYEKFTINIPPSRETGTLAYPTSSYPNLTYRFSALDQRERFNEAQFIQAINADLKGKADTDKLIFLGLHGFNNTFAEGVLRSAQLVHDYKIKGVPVHFSWPSKGKITRYLYDIDSAIYSTYALVDTLEMLGRTEAKGLVLYAHSMGAFALMQALERIKRSGREKLLDKIVAVVLASPDVDKEIFLLQLELLEDKRPRPFLIFVNKRDRALQLADFIRGRTKRVGQIRTENIKELQALDLAVIDLSIVKDAKDRLRHSVFASSPRVIALFTECKEDEELLKNISEEARKELRLFSKITDQDGSSSCPHS